MKRLFPIFAILIFLLCSCEQSYGILEYQSKEIVAECCVNGEYLVRLEKGRESCTLTVLEPQAAGGISFEVGERVVARASGVEIEMDKSTLGGICAIAAVFSQSEDCMTSAKEKGEYSVLTFENNGCTYQITLGKNNLPKHAKILSESFEYDIEICTIELKEQMKIK